MSVFVICFRTCLNFSENVKATWEDGCKDIKEFQKIKNTVYIPNILVSTLNTSRNQYVISVKNSGLKYRFCIC